MTVDNIIHLPEYELRNSSKKELISMVLSLRKKVDEVQTESNFKILDLQNKLSQKEAELDQLKKSDINNTANQPSSKQPVLCEIESKLQLAGQINRAHVSSIDNY